MSGGAILGFDYGAVFRVAAALGYDERMVAELLPAVERGMLAGLSKGPEAGEI